MTHNKQTVQAYMSAFRETDRDRILSCLTDDVEWEIPGAFHTHGKAEFAAHIVDEAQRHHLNNLRINEQHSTRTYRVPVFQLQLHAANG